MVVHEDADEHMVVKVIDFGLARPIAGEGTSRGSADRRRIRRHAAVSPARSSWKRRHPLDARSDIYSLGVTAWFLLTGKAAVHRFAGDDLHAAPSDEPSALGKIARNGCPRTGAPAVGAACWKKTPRAGRRNAVELRRERSTIASPASACTARGCHRPSSAYRPRRRPGSWPERVRREVISWHACRHGSVGALRSLIRPVGESRRADLFLKDVTPARKVSRRSRSRFLPPGLLAGAAANGDRFGARDVRLDPKPHSHPHLAAGFRVWKEAAGASGGFLIEEWINGGTLADLLAARGDEVAVTAVEGLRLLGQAAAAADHAASRGNWNTSTCRHSAGPAALPPGLRSDAGKALSEPRQYLSLRG